MALSSPESDRALLCDAVRAAGAVAHAQFGRSPKAWDKAGGAGPVSEADLAANRRLAAILRPARPDHGWLSEETPDDKVRLAHASVFIVDPIDGTRAFLAGQPDWCVAAAIVCDGVVVAAAAFFPVIGALYAASRGGGATRDDQPIRAGREATDAPLAVLAGSAQLEPQHWPGGVPDVARRFSPSLVQRQCLVAEGSADATLTFRGTWEWDVAAGALIAGEAGCVVTDATGVPPRFNAAQPRLSGLIVAPPPVHASLLARRVGRDASR